MPIYKIPSIIDALLKILYFLINLISMIIEIKDQN